MRIRNAGTLTNDVVNGVFVNGAITNKSEASVLLISNERICVGAQWVFKCQTGNTE
jgi:hypothetical protein